MDKLTFEQEYEVPFEVVLDEFTAQYSECGSHAIEISGVTDLKNLQKLYKNLSKVPGINQNEETNP